MTPERWQRLTELFDSALEHEPGDRGRFLASACADDPVLHREVEVLLESYERSASLGEDPAFRVASSTVSMPVEGSLPAGTSLGRYKIVAFLGAGGMGEVYHAHDPQLGRDVGIKILRRRGEITTDQLMRFEREARAVGALHHPNILDVHDVGVDAGVPYVVSELLDGETLRARLNAGPLSVPEAMEVARDVVAGLTAAHGKGIVHRDLKPENLFLTQDGVVKIVDFGLAKQIAAVSPDQTSDGTALTGQGLLVGTAGYMSPEQIRGQQADARSDVFAFGAVLYEMLTGRRAFAGDSVVETLHAILTADTPAVSTVVACVPAGLDLVVQRCLEKNLVRRFASITEVASALEAVGPSCECVPGADCAPVPGTRGAGALSGPGSARLRGLMAALAVLVAAVSVSLFVSGRSAPPSPGVSGRPALAVVAFDDHSGDPELAWLSDGLPRMLVTSLAQTPGLDVIGSERLGASFHALGRDAADRSARGEVAQHAGAGTVLVGSFFKVGKDIRIDVQLENVETGRVVAADSEQGEDVFALIDGLTGRIRAALDVEDRPAGRPVRDVTTDSLVAYELYVRGMDAWHNHRRSDARTLFEEAVRVDPTFALARSQLAVVLLALREPAAALEHHRMVMAQLDRLPERQRLLVEAKQEIETNPSRARQLTERLLERYPDEEEAYDLIVHTYSFTRDPEHWKQTLAFMQRWARAIPGPGSGHFHNHYGYALIDHGLFAEAEREFRAYIRVSPDEANPYDSLAELFLLTGRPRDAIAHYDRAIQLNPLFGSSYFGRAYATATLGRYDEAIASMAKLQEIVARAGIAEATVHLASAFFYSRVGRYRDAEQHIAAAVRLARELGDLESEADGYLLQAVLAFERRQPAGVLEAVDRVVHAASRMPGDIMWTRRSSLAHLIAGATDASRGDLHAAAARHAAQLSLGGSNDDIQLAWQQGLMGELSFSRGQLADADAAFRAAEYQTPPSFSIHVVLVSLANNLPYRDGLARTTAARGDSRHAIDVYRRLNQPDIASRWTAVLEPRFVLAAARLADRAGDRATARDEYARFLELWKDADEGAPEVAEARRYLGR